MRNEEVVMSLYLNEATVKELRTSQQKIYGLRNKMFEKYGVDLLDTDTVSNLASYRIVSSYDKNYVTNFARNGEDAKSGDVCIEKKTTRVKPYKRKLGYPKATFLFHAEGDLECERYLFECRDYFTLKPVIIYDVSKPKNVEKIIKHLYDKRDAWRVKGKKKHDVIILPETLLRQLPGTKEITIQECKVKIL